MDTKDHEFEEEYDRFKRRWPLDVVSWMETKQGRHRSLKDAIRLCMLKDVRTAAGLGKPPNKYTNNRSEAVNGVIKELTNRGSADMASFLSKLETSVFKKQDSLLEKGIYSFGEYRLVNPKMRVDPSDYAQMSKDQKDVLFKKFVIGDPEKNESLFPGALSMELQTALNILDVPMSFLRDLWANAEYIVVEGSIRQLPTGSISVIGYCDNALVTKGKCNCETFKHKNGLCAHIIAVENDRNNLETFLTKHKINVPKIVSMHLPKRAGEKANTKKKRKGKNNQRLVPINKIAEPDFDPDLDEQKEKKFTEKWHNNERFYIHLIGHAECKRAKTCTSCSMEFPQGGKIAIGSDIVIKHKERYV